jgi:hypothetical protein
MNEGRFSGSLMKEPAGNNGRLAELTQRVSGSGAAEALPDSDESAIVRYDPGMSNRFSIGNSAPSCAAQTWQEP